MSIPKWLQDHMRMFKNIERSNYYSLILYYQSDLTQVPLDALSSDFMYEHWANSCQWTRAGLKKLYTFATFAYESEWPNLQKAMDHFLYQLQKTLHDEHDIPKELCNIVALYYFPTLSKNIVIASKQIEAEETESATTTTTRVTRNNNNKRQKL